MMSGVEKEDVQKAILAGYTLNSLRQMLAYRLDKTLGQIVGAGALKTVVFDLIEVAEDEGWEANLIREAYKYNPGNASLLEVFERYKLAPELKIQTAGVSTGAVEAFASDGGFQRRIRGGNPYFSVNTWLPRFIEVSSRVCRLDFNGTGLGTAFLVGRDAVLTNYHSIEDLANKNVGAGAFSCVFDIDRLNAGLRVNLHPSDPLLIYSPYSAAEKALKPDESLPTSAELDFALLRLDRPIGSDRNGINNGLRGWETLPSKLPLIPNKTGIIIMQHPRGEPLKIAIDFDSVIGINENETRVRYSANTEGGSSGSPVFDLNWNLVALHHYGDPALGHPQYNQGILPLQLIREQIKNFLAL